MLPPDDEQIGAALADKCAVLASHAGLKLFNYEEALEVELNVGKWIHLAQTAALGSHPATLEDRPEIPKVSGPHVEEGREVRWGMYADGCTSLEQSKISARSGRAGGRVLAAETRSGPAGIVSKDPRIVPM
jgi:hypothetical protein